MSRDLALALKNLLTAMRERDVQMSKCDRSWGYFGHHYEEAVSEAEKEFADALNALIDERINARLGNPAERDE